MKTKLMMGVAALAFVAAVSAAKADVSYNFTFSGPSTFSSAITVSGQGTGTATGSADPYLITSASGFITGGGFTSFFTAPSNYLGANNQLYFNTSPFIVGNGLSFATAEGGINIRFANGAYEIRSEQQGGALVATATSGTLTSSPLATAVPGPLAGAGLVPLLGLAGAWFARRRHQKFAA